MDMNEEQETPENTETPETESESPELSAGPSFTAICVCGKLCTSKPGLTLHQRHCKKAQLAIKEGEPTVKQTNIIEPEMEYVKEVQELVDMVKDLAVDAHRAMTENNKSAGRRARIALTALKNKITPLRQTILEKMKQDKPDKPSK